MASPFSSIPVTDVDPWQTVVSPSSAKFSHTRNPSSASPVSLTSPSAIALVTAGSNPDVADPESHSSPLSSSDNYFADMVNAQRRLNSEVGSIDDDDIILRDEEMSVEEKSTKLQKLLWLSASTGNLEMVRQLLGGPAASFIDINSKDEEESGGIKTGASALIYASCFGHQDIVIELLRYGADVDLQDNCKLNHYFHYFSIFILKLISFQFSFVDCFNLGY